MLNFNLKRTLAIVITLIFWSPISMSHGISTDANTDDSGHNAESEKKKKSKEKNKITALSAKNPYSYRIIYQRPGSKVYETLYAGNYRQAMALMEYLDRKEGYGNIFVLQRENSPQGTENFVSGNIPWSNLVVRTPYEQRVINMMNNSYENSWFYGQDGG